MADELVVGVDLGGTKLRAGAVDARGTVVRSALRPAPAPTSDALLDRLVEAVEEVRGGQALRVGVGVPARVDHVSGRSVAAVHLPLEDVDLRADLGARLGSQLAVDNDATCALLAEWRLGAARGCRHAVLLTLGTGVGGGLVVDGRLVRGRSGAAGELGHVMVAGPDGPPCPCGARGCLEAVASGTALARLGLEAATVHPGSMLAREAEHAGGLTGAQVTRLAHDGDRGACEAIAVVGRWLGAGVTGIAHAVDPEVVVVGGGMGAAAGELLLEPAREAFRARALAPVRDATRIVAARFGDDAGVVGASLLARESLLGDMRP